MKKTAIGDCSTLTERPSTSCTAMQGGFSIMACVIHKFYDLTQLWIGISNGRSPIHCPRDLERRKRNCEHEYTRVKAEPCLMTMIVITTRRYV